MADLPADLRARRDNALRAGYQHLFSVHMHTMRTMTEGGDAHQAHLDREHADNLAGNPGGGNPYHDATGKFTNASKQVTSKHRLA